MTENKFAAFLADKENIAALLTCENKEACHAYLQQKGINASDEELKAMFAAMATAASTKSEGINLDEMDMVAGGAGMREDTYEDASNMMHLIDLGFLVDYLDEGCQYIGRKMDDAGNWLIDKIKSWF